MSGYCTRCGAERREGAQFCVACGATIAVSAPTAVSSDRPDPMPTSRRRGAGRVVLAALAVTVLLFVGAVGAGYFLRIDASVDAASVETIVLD